MTRDTLLSFLILLTGPTNPCYTTKDNGCARSLVFAQRASHEYFRLIGSVRACWVIDWSSFEFPRNNVFTHKRSVCIAPNSSLSFFLPSFCCPKRLCRVYVNVRARTSILRNFKKVDALSIPKIFFAVCIYILTFI